MMQFRISEICKEKGITLKELAERVGLSRVAVTGYASGRLRPSIDSLEKIAEVLEVDYYELISPTVTDIFCCPHCGKRIHIQK